MKVVIQLAALFEIQGAQSYLGEAVTQAQHMLQTGALAEAAGSPDALIAAALLHDVGHFQGRLTGEDLMGGIDNCHEETGAAYLRRWFASDVSEPVRLHVAAKRYLCHAEPGYLAALSPASRRTLEVQGGPMRSPEARVFEGLQHFSAALSLRRWDDLAKDPSAVPPPFAHFAPLLEALAEQDPD